MSDSNFELFEDVSNPLDSIEDVMSRHDWTFTRTTPDAVSVNVTGKTGTYRMIFLWQEEYSAMQFFCEYDMVLPAQRIELAARALRPVNERLWLGHFDIPEQSRIPTFRHTSLFRGFTQTSGADHVEDLVDIAIAECERHHAIFSMLSSDLQMDEKTVTLLLADEYGQA